MPKGDEKMVLRRVKTGVLCLFLASIWGLSGADDCVPVSLNQTQVFEFLRAREDLREWAARRSVMAQLRPVDGEVEPDVFAETVSVADLLMIGEAQKKYKDVDVQRDCSGELLLFYDGGLGPVYLIVGQN